MTGAGTGGLVLRVNGRRMEVAAGSSVADVVSLVTGEAAPRGVAVAIDRHVLPRSEWERTPARAGSLVEIVGAAAGG